MVTGGWVKQADRSRWQRKAAAELAVILAAHPGLSVIVWKVRVGCWPVRPGAVTGGG